MPLSPAFIDSGEVLYEVGSKFKFTGGIIKIRDSWCSFSTWSGNTGNQSSLTAITHTACFPIYCSCCSFITIVSPVTVPSPNLQEYLLSTCHLNSPKCLAKESFKEMEALSISSRVSGRRGNKTSLFWLTCDSCCTMAYFRKRFLLCGCTWGKHNTMHSP